MVPEGDHPPLEDNFTIESATLVGIPFHLSLKQNTSIFSIIASQRVSTLQLKILECD